MIRRWNKSTPPQGDFTLNQDCLQAQNLVAWYPFATASMSTLWAPDRVGSAHLTGGTAPTYTLDQWGAVAPFFVAASSQYLKSGATSPVTAPPYSCSAWMRPTTLATYGFVVGLGSITLTDYLGLFSDAGGLLYAGAWNSGLGNANFATVAGLVAGRWTHCAGVFASTTSRIPYADNVAGTANTVSNVPIVNCTVAGATGAGTNPFNGAIADVMHWNIAIGADVRARLNDPGLRFEHWYPLRSRKWISFASEALAAVGSALVTGSGAIAAFGAKAALGIALIAGSGAAVAVGQKQATGAASASGGGAVVATVSKSASAAVSASSGGTTVAAGDKQAYSLSGVSGSGSTTAAGTAALSGAAVVSSSGFVLAVGAKQAFSISSVTGSGEASAVGVASAQDATGTASVGGSGSVTVLGTRGALNSSAVSGGGAVVAAGTKQASGTSAVSGSGSVLATMNIILSGDPEWRYSVAADDLRYSIAADDLRYSVAADDLRYRVLPHEGS